MLEKKLTMSFTQRGIVFLPLVLFIFTLDQVSKACISFLFSYAQQYPVLSFFNIYLIHNEGAAFSFLSDAGGWQRWFFSILAAGVSLVLLVWLWRRPWHKNLFFCYGVAFVLAGALGNMTDRLILGYVVDFLDFHLLGYHWPAFNIADASILIGVTLLIIDSFVKKDQQYDGSSRVKSFK